MSKAQHTITDRELQTLVRDYLGRHPRYRHTVETGTPRAHADAHVDRAGRTPRPASQRPKLSSSASFVFGSPYRCEPCLWGIEELPTPQHDGNPADRS